MLVLAKSCVGREYLYSARSAHKVSNASAQKICDIANKYNFKLSEGECWHVHDVGVYDDAYDYAQYQKFTIRNGIVTEIIM